MILSFWAGSNDKDQSAFKKGHESFKIMYKLALAHFVKFLVRMGEPM